MYLLGLGLVLALLKYLEIGPVAAWSWWWVLSPFAITGLVVVLFALLVAYNVFAKNKPASGNAQENTGAKS